MDGETDVYVGDASEVAVATVAGVWVATRVRSLTWVDVGETAGGLDGDVGAGSEGTP